MSGLRLENVIKRYGATQVIHGVDLTIEDGEFCVFVGPSGCGKSTLLRMVAGLEQTTEGAISIGGRDVTRTDPAERGVAMVFQTYALYPHMSVAENMGFGLRMTGHPKAEIREKVAEASRILKLDDYLDRKPKALSGGQRQRVAIGRAIVRGRRCSSSTSRCRTSTRSCAWTCASRSPGSTRRSARR
jgi:lactose/L-arabinose transport system ATP-binding protein